jgi:hypothetical protein
VVNDGVPMGGTVRWEGAGGDMGGEVGVDGGV